MRIHQVQGSGQRIVDTVLGASGLRGLRISNAISAAQSRSSVAEYVKGKTDDRRPMVLVRVIQIQGNAILSINHDAIARIVTGSCRDLTVRRHDGRVSRIEMPRVE